MKGNLDSTKEHLLLQKEQNPRAAKPASEPQSIGFFQLFRFANAGDKVVIFFAILFSSLHGALVPGLTLIFSSVTDDFGKIPDPAKLKDRMVSQAFQMLYLGVAIFGLSSTGLVLWTVVGQRQLKRLRSQYFSHLVRKSARWFDQEKPGKLASAYYEHLATLMQVFGNKLHVLFQVITMTIFGFAVGFYKGWLVSLIILGISPLMMCAMTLMLVYAGRASKVEQEAYSQAGSVSDQTFEYIRTVKSLNGQEHQIAKYSESLGQVLAANKQFTWKISFFYALYNFSMSGLYSFCFFIGNLVLNRGWTNDNTSHTYTSGDYLGIYFGILTGISGLGIIAPVQRSIAEAKVAMARINQIVNEQNVDSSGDSFLESDQIRGQIKFENVSFAYPSAPDKPVLKNVSLTVEPGQKFAIVGPSGSGKSTMMQLLERFYDPTEGRILFDGVDIKTLDLAHYRGLLGLVSQQPVLFADTIANNLLVGIEDRKVSEEDIWASLERANIREFVETKLEEGLQTYVGAQGSQLSGGQKQRLSVARTLLRNPCVFLFDEATSALDRQNEKEIQETIDEVCSDVTSVSIAHRLQTVKNSDQIVVLVDGRIVERGVHEELLAIEDGVYCELYSKQRKEPPQPEQDSAESLAEDAPDEGEPREKGRPLEKSDVSRETDKEGSEKKELKLLKMGDYLGCSDVVMILLGIVASGVVGVNMPFTGYFFGKMMGVLGSYDLLHNPDVDPSTLPFTKDSLWHDGMTYVYVLLGISGASFVFAFFQLWFFSFVGEKFVVNIRKVLFRNFVFKDVQFFDRPANKPGNLSERLSEDCRVIRTVVAQYLGSILQSLISFGLGIGFGLYASWRISVLIICMSPLLFISGVLGSMMFMGKGANSRKEDENVVQESLNNIKVGL